MIDTRRRLVKGKITGHRPCLPDLLLPLLLIKVAHKSVSSKSALNRNPDILSVCISLKVTNKTYIAQRWNRGTTHVAAAY